MNKIVVFGFLLFFASFVATAYFAGSMLNIVRIGLNSRADRSEKALADNLQNTNSAVLSQNDEAVEEENQTPAPVVSEFKTYLAYADPVAELDGYVSSNETGSNITFLKVGKNKDLVSRALVTFDLTDLPQGAFIDEAQLSLFVSSIIGAPLNDGNTLQVDHLTYGDALDVKDFSTPSIISNFTNITNIQSSKWIEIDVSDYVKDDIANTRSYSQYRLHLEDEMINDDGKENFVFFESGENVDKAENSPKLKILYHLL